MDNVGVNEDSKEVTDVAAEEQDSNVSSFKNPMTKTKRVTSETNKNNLLILSPSERFSVVKEIEKQIDDEDFQEVIKKLTDNELITLSAIVGGKSKTLAGDIFADFMKDTGADWNQGLEYDGKDLNVRPIPVNKNMKGTLSGNKAVLKFSNFLGVGGVTQIPLWHSGFWISLNPISEVDIIDLEIRIGENQIALGRKTNGAVFSNDEVVYNRILMDFVISHMSDTTIKLNDDEDIRDYMCMQDMYTIILGLIEAIKPNGFNVLLACKNAVKLDKKNGMKCDYSVSGTVDPKKLLWVNRNGLSKDQIKHMTSRSPYSVSTEDVVSYQDNLSVLNDKEVNITTTSDNVITIIIKVPTIQEHISHGTMWVESVIDMVEDLLGNDNSEEAKNIKINEMSKATLLNTYLHFIKEIRTDDGVNVTDSSDISEVLNLFVKDKELYGAVVREIKSYINENKISVIGTPVYTCPTCKEDQDGGPGAFTEIIPLNVISTFFDLSTLRKSQAMKRENFTS